MVDRATHMRRAFEQAAQIAEDMERRRHNQVGDPRIREFVPVIANAIRAAAETECARAAVIDQTQQKAFADALAGIESGLARLGVDDLEKPAGYLPVVVKASAKIGDPTEIGAWQLGREDQLIVGTLLDALASQYVGSTSAVHHALAEAAELFNRRYRQTDA